MSLLSALLDRRDPEERAVTPSMLAWDRGDTVGAYYAPAGVSVDRDAMLGVSAVWACVSLISDSIATLPLGVYRDTGGYPQKTGSPGWLTDPNPEQTIVDFKFGTVASLLLHGNAFVYLVRDEKLNIREAWLLDPRWVTVRREPQPDGKLGLTYYVMVGQGMQSPVGPFKIPAGPEMFHIMAFQPNSGWPMGISPIDTQRMMFAGAIAGQEMGTRWFGEGFNAAGVIEVPDNFSPDQAKQLKRDFKDANTGGPRKMHLPPVLTGGATWKQIQISPEQAQFLEQRQFTVNEIARFFRVPPHMIGNLEKTTSWGTGLEEMSQGFVKFTLRPWIERIEESWTRNMLTFDRGAYFRFDTRALERGNMQAQADYFTKLHGVGMITANEGRAEMGLAPFDGGDEHYYMVNTAPVGSVLVEDDPVVVSDPVEAKSVRGEIRGTPRIEYVLPETDPAPFVDGVVGQLAPMVADVGSRADAARDAAGKALAEAKRATRAGVAAGEKADAARVEAVTAGEKADAARVEAVAARSDAAAAADAAAEAGKVAVDVEARLRADLDAERREQAKPKIRTVKLPGGRTATLLEDDDKRIVELDDGRRVEIE